MATKVELKARILELEAALEEALKPRCNPDAEKWGTGFVDMTVTPFDLDDKLHPDVREYKRLEWMLERSRENGIKAMNNFNSVADLLDKAVLCILQNDAIDGGLVGEYRRLMSSIIGTLNSEG